MKNIFNIVFLFALLLTSCEEVIELDLDKGEEQFVIDASIDWKKGTNKALPIVKLSYTSDYYDNSPSREVKGAEITISTLYGEIYVLEEISYEDLFAMVKMFDLEIPSDIGGTFYTYKHGLRPVLNRDYILSVKYQGETYISTARMLEAPYIDPSKVQQINSGGLFGNRIELKFFFEGFLDTSNHYLVKLNESENYDFFTLDDSFVSEKKMFFSTLGFEDPLEKGDTLKTTLYRISADYKQIVDLLLNVAVGTNGRGGHPSFSIPSRVYGNIIHQTDSKKNPLGAFRVAQYTQSEYIVK